MKHTPGPWQVWRGEAIRNVWYVHNGKGAHICHAPSDHMKDTATELANVRLIAAAPELLDVLRKVLDACNVERFDNSLMAVLYREVQQRGAHLIHTIDGKDGE